MNSEHVPHLQRMANESWHGSPEHAALTAAIASLSTPKSEGEWVLVPREPSAGMWDSAENAMIESECAYNAGKQDARSDAHEFPTMRIWQAVVGYRAMLAAAPQPPADLTDPPDPIGDIKRALEGREGWHDLSAKVRREDDTLLIAGLLCVTPPAEAQATCNKATDAPHVHGSVAQEQGGGEVVCWQRRVLLREGHWGQWEQYHDLYDEGRPEKVGRFKCQYRPLYTAPPSATVGANDAAIAKAFREKCVELGWRWSVLWPVLKVISDNATRALAEHSAAKSADLINSSNRQNEIAPVGDCPDCTNSQQCDSCSRDEQAVLESSAPVGVERLVAKWREQVNGMEGTWDDKSADGYRDATEDCANELEAFTQQPADCVGCEGNPAPENNPCAVCGQEPAAVDEAMAGWIADGDTIPAALISAARDAIRREFGVSGTDGYYKRILVRVLRALAAQPGGSDNDR